jgi:single-strand DNA-binding protein
VYQRIILVGNLGGDPQMRYLPSGQAVTNFSVATNRRWTDQQSGQQQEETVWWRVSVFGPQAEACNQYLSKGRQVVVEGRVRPDKDSGNPRVWQRQDGTWSASYDITALNVRFLGGRADTGGPGYQEPEADAGDMEADEIPF